MWGLDVDCSVHITKMQCSVAIKNWNFGARLHKFKSWLCHFHLYHSIGEYTCSLSRELWNRVFTHAQSQQLTKLYLWSNSCGFPMSQDLLIWICHGWLSSRLACSFPSNSLGSKLGKISPALEAPLYTTDPKTVPFWMLSTGWMMSFVYSFAKHTFSQAHRAKGCWRSKENNVHA